MYFVDFFLKVDDNGLNRFILKILKLNTTRRNKMKRTTKKIMAGTVALSCLTLGAGGLHAQVAQVLTIKASASVQGAYSQSYNSHTYVTTLYDGGTGQTQRGHEGSPRSFGRRL